MRLDCTIQKYSIQIL